MSPPDSPRPQGSHLRRALQRVDRKVSPPADALVRTNLFADSIAAMTRMEARLRRTVEGRTSAYWHFLNLPTATDLRRVRAQLSMVEARLRDLDERIEPAEAERAKEPAPKKAPAKKTPGGKR